MTVDYGDNVIWLSNGEVIEVVLPNGDSVWVRADGSVSKQRRDGGQ